MIFKKYVISITYNGYAIGDLVQSPNIGYGHEIKFEMSSVVSKVQKKKFMNEYGNMNDYPIFFDFYEEAYNVLDMFYYNTQSGDHIEDNVVKIETCFNDTPIDEIAARKYKIDKLLNR